MRRKIINIATEFTSDENRPIFCKRTGFVNFGVQLASGRCPRRNDTGRHPHRRRVGQRASACGPVKRHRADDNEGVRRPAREQRGRPAGRQRQKGNADEVSQLPAE